MRATLLHRDHIDYDIASCHLAIFSQLADASATLLHWVIAQLGDRSKKDQLLRNLPGGKKSLLVPLNVKKANDPQGPIARYMRNNGGAPSWYKHYLDDITHYRDQVLGRLRERGYFGQTLQTEKNEVYHATSAVEARVIRRTLGELRKSHGLFSHAIVHDAVVIHSDITETNVMRAFRCAALEAGFPSLRLEAKGWQEDIDKADVLLRSYGFSACDSIDPRGADERTAGPLDSFVQHSLHSDITGCLSGTL